MKKIFFISVMFFLCSVGLFAFESALNFTQNLSEKEIEELMQGDYISARTNRNQDVYRIAVPESEGYDLAYEASTAEHSFTVGVTQFIPYPESMKNLSDEEKMLEVYNRMLKISTLKGIQYKSFRAGEKYKTLFSGAHLIEGPKKLKAIPDPTVEEIELFSTYYAYLTDTKFGGNVYIADYMVLDDEICIEITNNDKIKYIGVKCVDEQDLHMFVDVKFTEEGLAVFAFAVAYDTDVDVKVLFTEVSLDGAFITRIKALKDWFIANMSV